MLSVFLLLFEVTEIIYAMEHKASQNQKRMYVPVAVCSYARRWAGRRGKGREGRKGSRKEECHRFSNSRKVTHPLSVPSQIAVFSHNRRCGTSPYINHE